MDVIGLGITGVIVVGVAGLALYEKWRGKAKERRRSEAAFGKPLSAQAVLADPTGWLPRLRGRIVAVQAVELVSSGGGEHTNTENQNFESYVVADDGELYQLEVGKQADALAGRAKQVADLLGVPFEVHGSLHVHET